MAERHARLLEVVHQLRALWSEERHESFRGFPMPQVTPPIVAGTNSVALAEIAGRHLDGVNTRFNHPQRAELLAAARRASGGREDFDVSVWAPFTPEHADREHPFQEELRREGVTRLVLFEAGVPDPDTIAGAARYLAG